MLLAKDDLSASNRATAQKIQRAAKDMEELTQAFLLLAREGDSGLAKERVSLNEIVRNEFARCELVYAGKNIRLEYDESAYVWVTSSPKVLAVVVGNLIRNACAYTDEGHVLVAVSDTAIRISDSGIGIGKDHLEAVFSPYYRVPNARESGHGIGLSLVKRMTDRFNWPIDISSRPGYGTDVVVRFPDAQSEPLTRATAQTDEVPRKAG
jgi:signal transduction histidine kinase